VVIVRMTRISVFFCSSCFSCLGVLPLFSLSWMERGAALYVVVSVSHICSMWDITPYSK
jgi:hypothetical protein